MVTKFDKYWKVIHGIMVVATVLDPRFKMKLLEFNFPKIYQNDSSYEINKIYELVTKYYLKSNTKEGVCQSIIASSSQSELV